MRPDLLLSGRLSSVSQTFIHSFFVSLLTSETPRISYGFQIWVTVRAVTTIRYAINAINAHPAITARPRFSFLSLLLCAFLWLLTRSTCSGLKSVFIRGAVAPGSELGLRTEYVNGTVTIPTTVKMKKGKNCPCVSCQYKLKRRSATG